MSRKNERKQKNVTYHEDVDLEERQRLQSALFAAIAVADGCFNEPMSKESKLKPRASKPDSDSISADSISADSISASAASNSHDNHNVNSCPYVSFFEAVKVRSELKSFDAKLKSKGTTEKQVEQVEVVKVEDKSEVVAQDDGSDIGNLDINVSPMSSDTNTTNTDNPAKSNGSSSDSSATKSSNESDAPATKGKEDLIDINKSPPTTESKSTSTAMPISTPKRAKKPSNSSKYIQSPKPASLDVGDAARVVLSFLWPQRGLDRDNSTNLQEISKLEEQNLIDIACEFEISWLFYDFEISTHKFVTVTPHRCYTLNTGF
jgi:hypothetical protein